MDITIKTIQVSFPALNKNDWLQENDIEIMRQPRAQKCEVVKVVELTPADYDEIAESLLTDRADLWEGIGGSKCYHPELDGVHWSIIASDPKSMELYRETSAVQVVKVVCTDPVNRLAFYVNTEGHRYARYVGRAIISDYTDDNVG